MTEREIEWIVGEVVRRLLAQAAPRATLSERLITLETLKNKLHGAQEIQLAPGAIVTPAARDELKRRGVVATRGGKSTVMSTPPAKAGLRVAVNFGCDVHDATLARLVGGCGGTLTKQTGITKEQIDRQMPTGAQRVAWFTSEPALALCLANRHANVWAIAGQDAESVKRSLASVSANVLVIDPRGKSSYALRSLLSQYWE